MAPALFLCLIIKCTYCVCIRTHTFCTLCLLCTYLLHYKKDLCFKICIFKIQVLWCNEPKFENFGMQEKYSSECLQPIVKEKKKTTTTTDPASVRVWASISASGAADLAKNDDKLTKNLQESLAERVQTMLKNKGDHTKYRLSSFLALFKLCFCLLYSHSMYVCTFE